MQNGTQVPDRTEWHNVVAWRASAEYAEKYIRKGSQLYVEGKIQTRSWEKDGIKRYTTEIYVESFQLLGKKPDSIEPLNTVSAPPAETIQAPPHAEDDLPF
jgi:single-strand DNA-binding protein